MPALGTGTHALLLDSISQGVDGRHKAGQDEEGMVSCVVPIIGFIGRIRCSENKHRMNVLACSVFLLEALFGMRPISAHAFRKPRIRAGDGARGADMHPEPFEAKAEEPCVGERLVENQVE